MPITVTLVKAEEGGHSELECPTTAKAVTECKPVEQHNPILPETSELILGSVSFLILLALMWKLGFPAIAKTMEARSTRIQSDLDAAEQAKLTAEQVLSKYNAELADAKSESNRIIEAARADAERVKADMIAATQNEVADLKNKAAADVEAARAQAMASLRSSVGDIAIELAEKVVEKNLDRATNQALVASFIQQVGG
jgi:F-type H+-transporting ATPase subunit b